jgi:hypothetical protein
MDRDPCIDQFFAVMDDKGNILHHQDARRYGLEDFQIELVTGARFFGQDSQ